MPLHGDWPIWDLKNPPSGLDGVRWSAAWFRFVAVDQYAREARGVRDAVLALEAVENCAYVEVRAQARDDGGVAITAFAGLRVGGVYQSPIRRLTLPAGDLVAERLRWILELEGPEAPFNAESDRRAREVGPSRPEAQFEVQKPLLAWSRLRRQGPGRTRRALLKHVKEGRMRYRGLGKKAPFTDMQMGELAQVVAQAHALANAVQHEPSGFWPLLPQELERLRRPPPTRNRPADYNDRIAEGPDHPGDLQKLRDLAALAHELTLTRLGYDPDDMVARGALRTQLSRAG